MQAKHAAVVPAFKLLHAATVNNATNACTPFSKAVVGHALQIHLGS